jgi:photosystem II cytochrome c550
MLRRGVFVSSFLGMVMFLLSFLLLSSPVQAATIDPYVIRYLEVSDSIELPLDGQKTQTFSAADLSAGKRLFAQNCLNCHVGGATLPNPFISLSLKDLRGAQPPRDTIKSLVAYQRQPMTYNGSEENYSCRQVTERWMSQTEVENLAAFILRAAEKAPAWGSKFE